MALIIFSFAIVSMRYRVLLTSSTVKGIDWIEKNVTAKENSNFAATTTSTTAAGMTTGIVPRNLWQILYVEWKEIYSIADRPILGKILCEVLTLALKLDYVDTYGGDVERGISGNAQSEEAGSESDKEGFQINAAELCGVSMKDLLLGRVRGGTIVLLGQDPKTHPNRVLLGLKLLASLLGSEKGFGAGLWMGDVLLLLRYV